MLTATPVNPYGRYKEDEEEGEIYWRPKYSFDSFEAFVKQLTENLVKKFNEFHGTEVRINELFERFVFRRTTATNVVIGGRV